MNGQTPPLLLEIMYISAAVRTNMLEVNGLANRLDAVRTRVAQLEHVASLLAGELKRLPCRAVPCVGCEALAAWEGLK